jgi:hypothetical protein
MMSLRHPTQMCWICGTAVTQQNQKTDEHGSAVHERCYAAKLALSTESIKFGKMPPRSASRLKIVDVAIGK